MESDKKHQKINHQFSGISSSWRKRRGLMCQLLLGYILFSSCIQSSLCISGWIEPRVVYSARGDKVSLLCGVDGMDDFDQPSSQLNFFNQSSGLTIDSQFVRVINRTAAELILPKVPEQRTTIYCKYGTQGVDTVEIFVGHKPDPIPKVDCFSYNWVDLNCSFALPENHVPVQYELKYFQGEKKDVSSFRQTYDCEFVTKTSNLFSCRFPETKYRRVAKILTFQLTATNILGSREQAFEFDNFKNIIPDAPTKFEKIGESNNSVLTTWKMPGGRLGAIEEKLDFQISVNSECSGEQTIVLNEFYPGHGTKNFSYLIPLNFSHVWYVIKIRMKISRAENITKMWSPWVSLNQDIQLAARDPDFPPEVNVGGFNILPNNDVYVYWRNVPTCYHNGKSFTYDVLSGKGGDPTELKESYAIYRKNVPLANEGSEVSIRSRNSVGKSKNASVILIPSADKRLPGPKAIKKRYVTENTTYVLTWSPPDNALDISSYTVFWCKSKTEGENKCDDKSFDFKVIDANANRVFEHKSDETVNFAISANSPTSTSGMFWTTCTTGESKEIGKIRSIWIPQLKSREIEIEWKLECTDKGIVVGYEIEYCLASAAKQLECIGPVNKRNLTGQQLEHTKYRLTDLTPYKTYGIVIRMFSSSTMGPSSDPLVNTTLSDAPSPIVDLMPRNIQNTSVDLIWMPPEHPNGVLLYYDISLDGTINRVDAQTHNSSNNTYTWKDLEPFKEHQVAVRACTNICSNYTKSSFTTEMGAPGKFKDYPHLQSVAATPSLFPSTNTTSYLFKWQEPIYKGGYLDFYEVKIELSPNDGSSEPSTQIYRMKSMQCLFDVCNLHKTGSATLYVRGVNFFLSPHRSEEASKINVHDEIKGSDAAHTYCNQNDPILMMSLENIKKYDNHSRFFYGEWSPQNSQSCSGKYGSNDSSILLVMVLSIVSIIFVLMILYLYRKIRDIKDIIVEFPPGLEELSGDKILKKSKNPLEVPDLLHNVDNTSLANEDEHKRLLRRSLNGSLNGGDCNSSINSENTRSENEHHDEIEYNDFGGSKQYEMSDNDNIDGRLQSFLLNPTTGKEVSIVAPMLVPHESMSSSTPRESPKPHIIMNPSDSTSTSATNTMPISSNGYVMATAPSPSNIQMNSNGYVTPSMFTPIQTQPSNGYTQLNRFGKPILNNDRTIAVADKMNLKTPMVATTDQNGISGYVTHKQLADYGHRMQ